MTTSETKLSWLDADDWRETAERGQPFTICDADNNDVATVYHNDHATVTTTPEQAAAYCRMFVAAHALYEALAALLGDLFFEGADDLYCEVCERPAPTDSDGTVIGRVHHADGCAYAAARAALSSARVEGA